MMEQDEPLSLASLQRGDPAAIEALMAEHGDRLLRAAYLFCGDRSEAQDLVQETFCRAIPALKGFRGDCLLYTWLYAILRRLCISHLRRQRRQFSLPEPLPAASAAAGPERSAEHDEARLQLEATLARLPAKHREMLLLRFGEGMKLGEISALLGISPGTVKSRLHNALRGMRDRMAPGMRPLSVREEAHEL